MAKGNDLQPGEFLDIVQGVVLKENRKNTFVNGRPSYSWYHKFMERNANIVQVRSETLLESCRAKLNRKTMDE